MIKVKYLILMVMPMLIAGCKHNSVEISGKLTKPEGGEFITLSEIGPLTLKVVDSAKLERDGKFSFHRQIENPTFYVLRTTHQSFLTILMEPGEKMKLEADYNMLNMPESVAGSAGTQKLLDYNKVLKSTVDKIRGLNEVYNQNADSKDLPTVMNTIDSTARAYVK